VAVVVCVELVPIAVVDGAPTAGTRANVGTALLDNNAIKDLRLLAEFFELNALGAEFESTLQKSIYK
jgi:hypothetical protein